MLIELGLIDMVPLLKRMTATAERTASTMQRGLLSQGQAGGIIRPQ
jgi:hypothetical protein